MLVAVAVADPLQELRILHAAAREVPDWGEDTPRRRPARVVGALAGQVAASGRWLTYAKVVAAFRCSCGDRFASHVHDHALARVRRDGPGVRKTGGDVAARRVA